MGLKIQSVIIVSFLLTLFSGIVSSGVDAIGPLLADTQTENAMSTTPIVYDNDEGGRPSYASLDEGVVTGAAGSSGPTIQDLLPKAPTIEEQLKAGELPKGESTSMVTGDLSKTDYYLDKETGLIKKDWPSGATYHDTLSYNEQESNAFQLVVIGDSIAYGNGLGQENKYYNQIAEDLRKTLKRPVEITVYAHSGAKISSYSESIEEMLFRETGQLPDASLNKEGPTLMEQAARISNDADLILVSGGINDVGVLSIIGTANTEKNIRKHTEDNIKEPMAELLTTILANTKTDAKILVTGYYQLVTEDTIMESQDAAVTTPTSATRYMQTGLSNAIKEIKRGDDDEIRISNSKAFYEVSTTSLQDAASAANKADDGRNRVVFVDPKFESANSYGASQPFLWELSSYTQSNDDQSEERSSAIAQSDLIFIDKIINKMNAIGHPNNNGASQYKKAIMEAILDKSRGLDWLLSDTTEQTTPTVKGIPKSLLKKEFLASLRTPMLSPTSDTSGFSVQNKDGTDVPETSGVTYFDQANDVWYIDAFSWSGDRGQYDKPAAPGRFVSGELNTFGYNWVSLPSSRTGLWYDQGYFDWCTETLASLGQSAPSAGYGLLIDESQSGGGGW